jgi:hypothetical protein
MIKPSDDKQNTLAWWLRVMVNIFARLYGSSNLSLYFRDYLLIVQNIRHFRDTLRDRGWEVPEAEQERLIGVLVQRCQKALAVSPRAESNGQAKDRRFIPGYLGKSLDRYVGELADELSGKYKLMPDPKNLSPDALAKFNQAMLASVLPGLRERWKSEPL